MSACWIRFALVIATLLASAHGADPELLRIRITTSMGVIEAELDAAHAPQTVANFLRYVQAGHYTSGQFHRTVRADNQPNNGVKIAVIQGGVNPAKAEAGWPAVPLERTSMTGLKHVNGTLSMARAGPDTATSDFFVCIGDQPELDFGGRRNPDGQGFAAFGRVTTGMEVVRAIQGSTAEGQRLTPPIAISGVERVP